MAGLGPEMSRGSVVRHQLTHPHILHNLTRNKLEVVLVATSFNLNNMTSISKMKDVKHLTLKSEP